jgi:Aspartyl protease
MLLFTTTAAAGSFTDTVPWPRLIQQLQCINDDWAEDSVTTSIPFSRAGNLIIVRAKADTTEGNFILDTGAPGLVLNITWFRDYPVTTSSSEEQTSITGAAGAAAKTEVKQFTLGALRTTAVTADLNNLGNLESLRGIKIHGLIGLSIFRKCELIIDYENNMLYIHRYGKKNTDFYQYAGLNNTDAYSTVPFEVKYEKVIITTLIAEKKVRFMIDSGAESNLLDSRLPDKIFENVEILKRIQLNGVGAKKVEALYGNLINLTVGDQNAGVMPFIITNLEKTCLGDNSCIDGILGFDFLGLHKIGFNFVKNKMYIWK